jgi:hypothetical protein
MQMKAKICLTMTVTRDESWAHHYKPESKYASMQLKHPSSPSTKKLEVEGYAIRLEGYAYRVWGLSDSNVSPF